MKKERELLFSVSGNDCVFDCYVGSGKGGQHRNKTSNCVRCTHKASGAVGKGEKGRSQRKNKELAFGKMAMTAKFKQWHKIESSRRMGLLVDLDKIVDREMENIKVECVEDGKWVKLKDEL